MSMLTPRDFTGNFSYDFDGDLDYIVGRSMDTIIDLSESYGGQFETIHLEFSRYRNDFTAIVEKLLVNLVLRNRGRLDDVLDDVILAALVMMAGRIRGGSPDSEDFIDHEISTNPLLESLDRRNGYDDRHSRRSSYDDRRDNYSRRDRGRSQRDSRYNDRGRRGARGSRDDRGGRDDDRRGARPYQRHKPRQENNTTRGARPASRQSVSREHVHDDVIVSNTTVENGVIVTRANAPSVVPSGAFPMAYVMGQEQVVMIDDVPTIKPYTGTTDVDYEKHRIDRFYPNIIGDNAVKTDLTKIALEEANKALDNAIQAYIVEPETSEISTNVKAFNSSGSGVFNDILHVYESRLDPIQTRHDLVSRYNVNVDWFAKNSLVVCLKQHTHLGELSNDVINLLKRLFGSETLKDFVHNLALLIDKIDPIAWKKIHDVATTAFNKTLIRVGILSSIDSLIQDWSDICKLMKEQSEGIIIECSRITLKNIHMGVASSPSDDNPDVTIHYLTEDHKILYLPITSGDLDICTTDVDGVRGVINSNSGLFELFYNIEHNNIKALEADGVNSNYATPTIVTLDGSIIKTYNITTPFDGMYELVKVE